jgi:hypothetical protein
LFCLFHYNRRRNSAKQAGLPGKIESHVHYFLKSFFKFVLFLAMLIQRIRDLRQSVEWLDAELLLCVVINNYERRIRFTNNKDSAT